MPVAGANADTVQQIVPKASNVAETLHQVMPEPVLPASTGTPDAGGWPAHVQSALTCPHTGEPCPALTALFSSLAPSGEDADAWLRALAPCSHCHVSFDAGRAALRHVRLGQREREILIAAEAGALEVTERGMTRSVSAARRRAAISLGKAGLVAPLDGRTKGTGGPPRATVALTELGRYVMAAYGRYLRAGKPVRWTRPLRGTVLPGRNPGELKDEVLARTETALRDTLGELKGVLIAAVGGKLKDPSRLEQVTRHLERKAAMLKAVLQPARAGVA